MLLLHCKHGISLNDIKIIMTPSCKLGLLVSIPANLDTSLLVGLNCVRLK